MEYKEKKKEILQGVQYQNLLSFNLVENKLERNFKSIVEALLLVQNQGDGLNGRTDLLEQQFKKQQSTNRNYLKDLYDKIGKLEVKINGDNTVISQQDNISLSVKDVELSKKQLSQKNFISGDNSLSIELNNQNNKKMQQMMKNIQKIKESIPSIQLLEVNFETMQKEINMIKGQLMSVGKQKSNKSLKRQSIGSMIKQSEKAVESNCNIPSQNKENFTQVISSLDVKPSNQKLGNGVEGSFADKQLNGMRIEINTLNLSYEELKDYISDLRKKDIKNSNALAEMMEKMKKIEGQMRGQFDGVDKKIKEIRNQMMNSQMTGTDKPQENQQSDKKTSRKPSRQRLDTEQINPNYKNMINDKISKLQSSILGFITQTQFNRFRNQTRDKVDDLSTKHQKQTIEFEEQIKKIYDMFISKDGDISAIKEQMGQFNDHVKERDAQNDRKHNIALSKIEQLKKGLQNLREDLEFYKEMGTQMQNVNQQPQDRLISQNSEAKEQKPANNDKQLEDLKRYFNGKLHDQRAYLVGLVRDLEKKLNNSGKYQQQITNLWDKIAELNLFIGKKADQDDTKKNLLFLEKKLSRIAASLSQNDENTEDARIGRTNWFCLSCDKNLAGYQGKVGKHVVWDTMPLKGVVKQLDRKGLPSLKR